jgi:hypothetical protein
VSVTLVLSQQIVPSLPIHPIGFCVWRGDDEDQRLARQHDHVLPPLEHRTSIDPSALVARSGYGAAVEVACEFDAEVGEVYRVLHT